MANKENIVDRQHVVNQGGPGSFSQFGGELSINQLNLSTEYHGELESLKDLFKKNYTFRCQSKAIITRKIREAQEFLSTSYSVVIYGAAGEGKTVCAFKLAKEFIDKGLTSIDRCALICDPGDIKQVKSESVDLIIIDNIFGKHNADRSKLSAWESYFETLDSLALCRKVRVIIASRMHILFAYQHELKHYHVFANGVHLDSTELSKAEKKEILECHLTYFNRVMDEYEIEKCISEHNDLVGFPLCCQLFASGTSVLNLKAAFFKPTVFTFLDSHLQALETKSFIALVYVFVSCNKLKCTDLDIDKMTDEAKKNLVHIAALHGITIPVESLIKETRGNIESLKGSYVKEINGNIIFIHDTIYEAVARMMLKTCSKVLIEKCTVEFLCQCIRLNDAEFDTDIVIRTDDFDFLVRRCINEVVGKRNAGMISKHPAFKNSKFTEIFMRQFANNEELIKNFFSVGVTLNRCDAIHGFLYHYLSQEEINETVFEKAYVYLLCRHTYASNDSCWKCLVKEEALAGACWSNKKNIYEELSDDEVKVTSFCLLKAVENPNIDPELVSNIIDDLKNSNRFYWNETYIQMSLGLSLRHQDDTVFKLLQQNGLKTTVYFLYYLVKTGDFALLSSSIKELAKVKRWKADNHNVSRAILEAHVQEKSEIINLFLQNGATLNEGAIYWAVLDYGYDVMVKAVHLVQSNGNFDCESNHIAWALAVAMKQNDQRICKFLRDEGVIATPALVCALAELGESTVKIHGIVKELKENGRWDPECRFIAGAYMASTKRANKELFDLLTKEGVCICPPCFYFAVIHYADVVEDILKALKAADSFDSENSNLARTLVWATEYRDADYIKWLQDKGLYFNMACLRAAVDQSFSLLTLEYVINQIKNLDKWDTLCDHALVALNHAFIRKNKTAFELLVSEGIEMTPRSAFLATKYETLQGLKLVLQNLKEKQMLNSSSPDVKNAMSIARFKRRDKFHEIKRMCKNV